MFLRGCPNAASCLRTQWRNKGVAEASQPSSPTKQLSMVAKQRRPRELTKFQMERFYRWAAVVA